MTDTRTPCDLNIIICGGGLAGQMTAAALANQLPPKIAITLVDCPQSDACDPLYGGVTAPSAYDFNRAIGIAEPELILQSDTAFSFGTHYRQWGGRSWFQGFQQPLAVIDQVLLPHYLARLGQTELEPYLISAMAARSGVFAHPPEQPEHPLSRAEYGYQFDPASYAALFARATGPGRVKRVAAGLATVERDEAGITALHLSDGQTLRANLYVDCTGPKAALLSLAGGVFSGERRLGFAASRAKVEALGAPCRTLTAHAFGWQSETPLKGGIARLSVFAPEDAALAMHGEAAAHSAVVRIGRYKEAWRGNCVGIGQAAAVIEPLTPAPVMLLQRDIERLLSLIPVSDDMAMEQREYNRQYTDDCDHAALFQRALFETSGLPQAAYWAAACAEPVPEKLQRKIEQFESRGLHVGYDLEPFQPEDWTILHYGMGRHPERYDRVADNAPKDRIAHHLAALQHEIGKVVTAMPSHMTYMTNLTRYLLQQKG